MSRALPAVERDCHRLALSIVRLRERRIQICAPSHGADTTAVEQFRSHLTSRKVSQANNVKDRRASVKASRSPECFSQFSDLTHLLHQGNEKIAKWLQEGYWLTAEC